MQIDVSALPAAMQQAVANFVAAHSGIRKAHDAAFAATTALGTLAGQANAALEASYPRPAEPVPAPAAA
jgi:hypothetical protein